MRLAWCDAVAFVAWVPLTFFALFFALGEAATPGLHQHGFITIWFDLSLITVLPLWLFLRAIDLAIGGPARRRGMVTVRPIRD